MKLAIKNFQSIKRGMMEFPPGVTVITGASGSGKTAILRALYALIANKRGSQSYIRRGESEAAVAVQFPGGEVVKWERTKTGVKYTVGGKPYEKAGRSRLSGVAETFPLVYDEARGTVQNFIGEWDHLFPFDSSPSEIFLLFEDIFKIESASKILELMKADSAAKKAEGLELDRDAEILSKKLSAVTEAQANLNTARIEAIRDSYQEAADLERKSAASLMEAEAILASLKAAEGTKPFEGGLEELKSSLRLQRAVDQIDWLNIVPTPPQFEFGSMRAVEEEWRILANGVREAEDVEGNIDRLESSLESLTQDLAEVELVLGAVEVCPLCGTALDHKH